MFIQSIYITIYNELSTFLRSLGNSSPMSFLRNYPAGKKEASSSHIRPALPLVRRITAHEYLSDMLYAGTQGGQAHDEKERGKAARTMQTHLISSARPPPYFPSEGFSQGVNRRPTDSRSLRARPPDRMLFFDALSLSYSPSVIWCRASLTRQARRTRAPLRRRAGCNRR